MHQKDFNVNLYNENSLVHKTLAYSYSIYFLAFLGSAYLDLAFPIKLFSSAIMAPLGAILLIWATFLIFWAQKTSRRLDTHNLTKESFCHGPYCFTRSPTHCGLLFLLLGFGFIANAFFIILFTIATFFVSKLFFLKKQERLLEAKYGAPYLEYKKSVRF